MRQMGLPTTGALSGWPLSCLVGHRRPETGQGQLLRAFNVQLPTSLGGQESLLHLGSMASVEKSGVIDV